MATRKVFIGKETQKGHTPFEIAQTQNLPLQQSSAKTYSVMCDIDQAIIEGEDYAEQNKWSVKTYRVNDNYVMQVIHPLHSNPNIGSIIMMVYMGRPGIPLTIITESRMDNYKILNEMPRESK